ncbi:histidinol-phosphate transaminase [Salinibacillus xinjiangensis]|uniref:Histidinol-phosphate aminotransferase n=1 Tax=Salinibacillus xinjiangensis TaxID=1229268 RepID=A0A6G1X8L4_9BACI|nr:histidinol-phosphate transaminase [Salinibacillus xinjiangensis]MRG87246.1 histidinol-phosphate transaminase [Salinibacillus xinjiangensis]
MSKFWSERLQATEPYIPGEQPNNTNVIKLNTNENPYPPSPKALKAIQEATDETLRLYPPPTVNELRETIAKYHGVHPDQVFIGNGSDEVLAFSFMAFFNPGEPILFPDITYSFYPVYAKLFNIDYKRVPVRSDFTLPVEEFFQSEGGVIFPNPNAPTGLTLSLIEVESIVNQNPDQVVIIDEAYIDFGGQSAVQLVNQYENLLVIQTLSKSRSLAGMRVGFAIGDHQLIEGLNRIKNSFNSYTLDRLAIAAAKAAFDDEEYFQDVRGQIIHTREQTSKRLHTLGFEVIDSKANFLFVRHPHVDAEDLYLQLKEQNIFVRYFNKPRIQEYLRISIGTADEMEQFIIALEPVLQEVKK